MIRTFKHRVCASNHSIITRKADCSRRLRNVEETEYEITGAHFLAGAHIGGKFSFAAIDITDNDSLFS